MSEERPKRDWRERHDEEVTPPPHDPTAAYAWSQNREKISSIEIVLAKQLPMMNHRIEALEAKDGKTTASLSQLEKNSVLQTHMLEQLTKQKAEGDTRVRWMGNFVLQALALATSILAAALTIASRL